MPIQSVVCQQIYQSESHEMVTQFLGVPQCIYLLSLRSIRIAVCLQMLRNCSDNQRPENGGNSAGHGQKFIRPVQFITEFIY